MKIKPLFLLTTCLVILARCLYAGEVHILQEKDLAVFFEPPLKSAAKEVVDIYPEVKVKLETIFRWDLNLVPSVVLIKDSNHFQKMAESPLTVAFAVPAKSLIVIDYSKMNVHPFNLEITLKHELCHLLLHHYIREENLPRWLDEGVAQWASDGIGDIIMDQKRSLLNKAALKGKFIPLSLLQKGFPRDKELLILAYEESKSFVAHIIGRFGKEGILRVLEQMRQGQNADAAILKALSVNLDKLEKQWHHSLKQKVTWFTYLSYHLYEILFALMALITVYAFIRIMMRKRAYMKEEEEIWSDRAEL